MEHAVLFFAHFTKILCINKVGHNNKKIHKLSKCNDLHSLQVFFFLIELLLYLLPLSWFIEYYKQLIYVDVSQFWNKCP